MLNKDFPKSPYEILHPNIRWRPDDDKEQKLLPPLVPKIRNAVYKWRENRYEGATETSKALLNYWFNNKERKFQYYFAQREAVESVIYLYEVAKAHSGEELRKFQNYSLSSEQFKEDWIRYVIKLATGTGKTKVLSLIIAWAYFNKLYEKGSQLSKNFLLITPNIIVLERLIHDFKESGVFFKDQVIPENGYKDRYWFDEFQMDVHIQDDVRVNKAKGNLFLTNVHRIYHTDIKTPSVEDENTMDYFLGVKAKDAKEDYADLGRLVREIDELIVLNDEAHHIRDNQWADAIRDLHNHLMQKDKQLSLQIDVTATPKFEKGQIFPQTICDYPLVEAIHQRIVKHPILPDGPSQAKCTERESIKFVERYKTFIDVGVNEWLEQYKQYQRIGKKPLLFVMVDRTENCDEVAEYLEKNFKELNGSVLSIHTNKSGEISESTTSKKNKEELDRLRDAANNLDDSDSQYKAVVSVLVLKEGWDVKNVTTIVGLRAYGSDDNVLAEQTLGRGLRRINQTKEEETVSVIGTQNFIDFIQSIEEQGVEFDKKAMGGVEDSYDPILIEVDRGNKGKNLEKLDIELPIPTPKIYRAHDRLEEIDVSKILNKKSALTLKQYEEEDLKEIIFERAYPSEGEEKHHHKLKLDIDSPVDVTNLIRWFVRAIKLDLRLGQVEHILYQKLKEFIVKHLFGQEVDLKDRNVIRNLSEIEVKDTIFESMKKAINEKTVLINDASSVSSWIRVSETKPFHVTHQNSKNVTKSVFNKIVGDSEFELDIAKKLEGAEDIISFAKNYFAVNFRLDYQDSSKQISNYVPDFFVKKDSKTIYILEVKGSERVDDPLKFDRLVDWCEDVNKAQDKYRYIPLYIKQEKFEKYKNQITRFEDLVKIGVSEKLPY